MCYTLPRICTGQIESFQTTIFNDGLQYWYKFFSHLDPVANSFCEKISYTVCIIDFIWNEISITKFKNKFQIYRARRPIKNILLRVSGIKEDRMVWKNVDI